MAFATIDVTKGITGTIPVANGGTGLTSGTTGQFLKFTGSTTVASAAVVSGFEEYDIWVVTTSFNNIPGHISSNWSRFSDTGFEKIGTGMTNSGYSFLFPSTGKYIVDFHVCYYINDTNEARYFEADIEYTNDNWSNSHRLGEQYTNVTGGIANTYTSMMSTALVDITNTTNDKVRFKIGSSADTSWAYVYAASATITTGATFRKIGDT
jgi:hypothetical protein